MKIIVSPSKTQNETNNFKSSLKNTVPMFLDEAIKINEIVKEELKENKNIWAILEIKDNDKLKSKTIQNVDNFNETFMQAILKYNGLQFKNLDFESFTPKEQEILNKNVFISSAYYGLLKPSDLISSYRLMMNSKIYYQDEIIKNFWKKKISDYLESLNEEIINLASVEYGYVLDRKRLNVIDVTFLTTMKGKLVNNTTNSKECRGKMVNIICKQDDADISFLKTLVINNHRYDKSLSTDTNLVFVEK